jgi:uncharacterized membrane protein
VTAAASLSPRRRYIDWARGIAVLIMIQAHALDAWTRPADRSLPAFGYFLVLGGFAAPMFLWLAGLGLVLSAERVLTKTGRRSTAAEAVVRRGVEIFILAFLFRIQAFIISPGSSPVTLFRVDILNVMGPAMAAAGLIWAIGRNRLGAALACGITAVGLAMLTPVVRQAAWVSALPVWTQWYLRPFGDHTTFTLLPWAGFVFAGAAYGSLLGQAQEAHGERLIVTGLSLTGAAVLALGLFTASLPSIYAVSNFWTSSPTYFAVRIGVLMVALGILFSVTALEAWTARPLAILEKFGRNSLFVYWIHVELVYGYATWVIHRRLPLWGTGLAYLVFCAAMYAAILLRDRVVTWWKTTRTPKSSPARRAAAQA